MNSWKRIFTLTLIAFMQAGLVWSSSTLKNLSQDELKAIALKQTSLRSGAKIENLSIIQTSTPNTALTKVKATTFTLIDAEQHTPYDITLDDAGQEVSRETLLANEDAAYAARYGKLTPALSQALEKANADVPVSVVIVFKDPGFGPDRPQQPFMDSQTPNIRKRFGSGKESLPG